MSVKSINAFLVTLFVSALAMTASAQIGGANWSSMTPVRFNVQWPYTTNESARYSFSNGVYHMWVYSNDAPFQAGSTTLPRTEHRFVPDYVDGDIQYQSRMMVPSDTSGTCIFQIHTGDALEHTFGSTAMMLFWFATNGGSVYQHSGTRLVTNLVNQWFQVNVDHNLNAHIITVWINGQEVWQNIDNGAGDFYFKNGVYGQNGESYEMENYITNILVWTNLTTNPFPGFYDIQNSGSALAACVRGALTNNGTAIVQSNFVGSVNALWYLVPTSGGFYRIMNLNSGLALTVQNAATTNNAPIVQWQYSAGGSSDWMPKTNHGGSFTFTNRLSGKALEVSSTSQDQQLDLTNFTGSSSQQWQLIPASEPPDVLQIMPSEGLAATINAGNAPVGSQIFSLTNTGTSSVDWFLVSTSLWLGMSPTNGTLAAGGQATVTVSLNAAAAGLPVGSYVSTLIFADLTTGFNQSRQFALQVLPLVSNGGFETGDFTDWTLSGNVTNLFVTGSPIYVHSGNYAASLGPIGSLGYLSQMVPTVSGQSYLLSFWLENAVGGTPNEFSVSWNGNVIYDQVNLPQFGWTNLQFTVTGAAASTNMLLQFGFRNDPQFFGLDDVSVNSAIAVTPPVFQRLTLAGNAFAFSWSAVTGTVYQLQYKTNLLQPAWLDLGGAITAADVTLSVTNVIGPDPQRFYRLKASSP